MHICVHAQSCYMQACIHTYKLAFPHACIHTCRSACRQSLILHVGMFTCIHAHIHTDNKWQERVAYANTFVLLVFNCAEKSRTTSRHSRIQYIIGRTHCMRVVIDTMNYVSHPHEPWRRWRRSRRGWTTTRSRRRQPRKTILRGESYNHWSENILELFVQGPPWPVARSQGAS